MRNKATPYKIAEICYNPEWPDAPWYIVRVGTVAEQGGLNFGEESISFGSLSEALGYIEFATNRDCDEIKRVIENKKGANN